MKNNRINMIVKVNPDWREVEIKDLDYLMNTDFGVYPDNIKEQIKQLILRDNNVTTEDQLNHLKVVRLRPVVTEQFNNGIVRSDPAGVYLAELMKKRGKELTSYLKEFVWPFWQQQQAKASPAGAWAFSSSLDNYFHQKFGWKKGVFTTWGTPLFENVVLGLPAFLLGLDPVLVWILFSAFHFTKNVSLGNRMTGLLIALAGISLQVSLFSFNGIMLHLAINLGMVVLVYFKNTMKHNQQTINKISFGPITKLNLNDIKTRFISQRFVKGHGKVAYVWRQLQLGLLYVSMSLINLLKGSDSFDLESDSDLDEKIGLFVARHYLMEKDLDLADKKRHDYLIQQMSRAVSTIKLHPFIYSLFMSSLNEEAKGFDKTMANYYVGLLIEQQRTINELKTRKQFQMPVKEKMEQLWPAPVKVWFNYLLKSQNGLNRMLFNLVQRNYPVVAKEQLLNNLPASARSAAILSELQSGGALEKAYWQVVLGRTDQQREQGVIALAFGMQTIIEQLAADVTKSTQMEERLNAQLELEASTEMYNELFKALKVRKTTVIAGRRAEDATLSQMFVVPTAVLERSQGRIGRLTMVLESIKRQQNFIWKKTEKQDEGLIQRLHRSARHAS